jgi:glucose-6-phosphate isomerase
MKFLYKDSAGISATEILSTADLLQPYIKYLNETAEKNDYTADEASMNLPFDNNLLEQVTNLAKKKASPKLKYLILIGIGGSNLGTKAIYDAFFGFYDTIQITRFPKIIFLDTQDEEVLAKTIELIKSLESKDEILVNAISKSGGTTETIANLEVIYNSLTEMFGNVTDRFVITTDAGSKMQEAAQKKGIDYLNLPKKVGGRFSVFSAVGMFPFAVLGFNVVDIINGAKEVRDIALQKDINVNNSLLSACILFLQSKKGKIINDNFIFLPQLESLGKWYRQLMGESIGKEGKGITPTVSIGSTDLHSVGQLYLGGPKDKITTFIYGNGTKYNATVPTVTSFGLIDVISNKHIHTIMNAIVEGTKIAYQKQGLPFMEIILDTVSEVELGRFMQFKMMEMMFLGKLFEVNTFDQPHVELYKIETKKILSA